MYAIAVAAACAFLAPPAAQLARMPPRVRRALTPRCVRDDFDLEVPTLDTSTLRIGSVEPADMEQCIDVLMDGFYKDMLTLAADEFSEEEMEKMRPTLSLLNGGFSALTRTLLGAETRKRLAARLESGGIGPTGRGEGLMLALQERSSGAIVAVVELSTQPLDGKVPGDLRLPDAPWAPPCAEVAYLCNLAVLSSSRGRGLGTALIDAIESLASRWGYKELYLHAATGNERLLSMYAKRQYEALPSFDQPWWVLAFSGREPTRYHRKSLRSDSTAGADSPPPSTATASL